jgi:hypothetical protein
MRIRDAYPCLRDTLDATGQDLERLEPWEAWRTFKQFLHSEIENGYDAVSVQFDIFPDESLSVHEATLLRPQTTRRRCVRLCERASACSLCRVVRRRACVRDHFRGPPMLPPHR